MNFNQFSKENLTLIFLSTLFNAFLFLTPSFFLKSFIAISPQDFFILIVLFSIAFYSQHISMSYITETWAKNLREDLFQRQIEKNSLEINSKNAAQCSSEIITGVQQFKNLVEKNVPLLLHHTFVLIGASSLIVYFTKEPYFFTLCVLPCLMIPQLYFSKHLTSFFKATQMKLDRLGEYIFETLSQLKTVQFLNHQKIDKLIIHQYLEKMLDENIESSHRSHLFFMCYFLCVIFILSAILFVGMNFIQKFEFKTVLAFSYLFILIVVALFSLGKISFDVSRMITLYQSFQMNIQQPKKEFKKLLEYPAKGVLAIHNVSFAYPAIPHQMVLHNINISIYPGEFIALVGPSGAGKTTFLNLIVNFYQSSKGKIYLDGISVADLDPTDLRDQITLVDQEPELFSASVFENILYGNPMASDKEIEDMLELIMPEETWQLPKGLRTPVGPRGVGLSIGQKQCIALCRGLLRNTSILLLDEATSGIDSYSEDLINNNLKFLLQNKTTVMVTHKLAHIEMADRVLMMHGGRIVGFDTHENLYSENALYRKLILLEYNKEDVKQYA